MRRFRLRLAVVGVYPLLNLFSNTRKDFLFGNFLIGFSVRRIDDCFSFFPVNVCLLHSRITKNFVNYCIFFIFVN